MKNKIKLLLENVCRRISSRYGRSSVAETIDRVHLQVFATILERPTLERRGGRPDTAVHVRVLVHPAATSQLDRTQRVSRLSQGSAQPIRFAESASNRSASERPDVVRTHAPLLGQTALQHSDDQRSVRSFSTAQINRKDDNEQSVNH